MEHNTESTIHNQVTILPDDSKIKPSSLVSYLRQHATSDQLGSKYVNQAEDSFEVISGLLPPSDDDSLYYVAVYAPAYTDVYGQWRVTSLTFFPFASWRNGYHSIGYAYLGYRQPWRAYLWSTYIGEHDYSTTYESLEQSPNDIKNAGLVAEGIADEYYEYYTFPTDYKVEMKKIDNTRKVFYDPVRNLVQQALIQNDTFVYSNRDSISDKYDRLCSLLM